MARYNATDDADFIVRDLEQFTEERLQGLFTGVYDEVSAATPVDTTWARSNWLGSVGTPDERAIPNLRREQKLAQVGGRQGEAAAGRAVLARYKLSDGAAYIVNSVPYIVELNSGSSTQAPTAFVQLAIERAIAKATAKP